jgi:hypothetical protein
MNKTGYPVEWRGQTLYLSDRSDKVKAAFCRHVANRMLDNARETMPAVRYYSFERSVMSHLPEWTTIPDPEVVTGLAEKDAGAVLLRLHLDATRDEITDEELQALIDAKQHDPHSDYSRAMRLINGQADPKAEGASSGSQAPTDASEPRPNSAAATSV